MVSPFFRLFVIILSRSCSFLSVSAINKVSTAYLMLKLYRSVINSGRIFSPLMIPSLYRLTKTGGLRLILWTIHFLSAYKRFVPSKCSGLFYLPRINQFKIAYILIIASGENKYLVVLLFKTNFSLYNANSCSVYGMFF